MSRFRYILFFIFLTAISGIALPQTTGTVTGTVVDSQTGEPLFGANVFLQNTFWGAATGESGEFAIAGVTGGDYTLKITMIGYRPFTTPLRISATEPSAAFAARLVRDFISVPQVVVTASRSAEDIMDLPLSVSVMGPRDITDKNAVTVDEALAYVPGVTIVKDQLNIRGASGYTLGAGNRSLLLLDGIPIVGSAAGNITWSIVPASEIDRIEIVKSGASAMYGSGALGGVVNIITRNAPLRPETRLRAITGIYSQPRYSQWDWRDTPGRFTILEYSHSRPIRAHGAWLRVQTNQTDGYTQLGWSRSLNLTSKAKLNFGNKFNASLFGNLLADEGGIESQWKSPIDPFEAPDDSRDDRSSGTKLNLNSTINAVLSPRSAVRLKTALYDVRWQNHGTNNDRSNEQKLFAELQDETRISRRWHATSGITIQRASIDADIFGQHQSFTGAAYGLLRGNLGQGFSASLGGRFESFSVDDSARARQLIPQVAANYRPTDWLAFRASVSRGFRSPTIAELYSSSRLNVFVVRPNPGLVPETSRSAEIGFTLRGTGPPAILPYFQFDGAWFRTDYRDLIEPTPDNFGVIHFENVTNARISGFDVGLLAKLLQGRMDFQAGYTYLNPVVTGNSGETLDTLSYRYRHYFTETTAFHFKSLTASIDSRHTSRMEKTELFDESPASGRDKRVPVRVWNGSLAWTWKQLEARLRIENIFQYYYVELERNMGEERNISLSVLWKF